MIFHRHPAVAQRALIVIGISTIVQVAIAQERTIRVDIGLDSQPTSPPPGTGWNNFGGPDGTEPVLPLSNLKDTQNALTGITFTPTWSHTNDNTGVSAAAANYLGPYPFELTGLPTSALEDSLYVRDGESFTATLSNIPAGKSFNFLLYAASGNSLGEYSLFTVTGGNSGQGHIAPIINNSTQVVMINNIVPDATQKITVMLEGRRSDGSPQNPWITADAMGRWNFVQITQFRLGDYSQDNIVNTNDYTTWRSSFGGTTAGTLLADGNGNGTVDAADYVVWRKAFGAGSGASLSSTVSPLPEPCTVAMVVIALVGLWGNIVRSAHRAAQR